MSVISNPNHAEFFLVTLPGLEDLVQSELNEWFTGLDSKIEYGGVTVFAPLETGLGMNLVLKTPTRILVRVARFMCRDFPKLFRKVSTFPWREWVDPGCEIEVHAASKRSRLKIKKRIEETCFEAWEAQRKTRSKSKLRLYVRVQDDEVTLSLDTSGERLHKRGLREHIGEAPLRETIAAALLLMLKRQGSSSGQPVRLIDPMMGSGTFFIEAAHLSNALVHRDFALEAFRADVHPPAAPHAARPEFTHLIGFEKDPSALKAARHNFEQAGVRAEVWAADFFLSEPLPTDEACATWIIANPPYGERLAIEGSPREFYEKLFANCERVVKPDLAAFLLPAAAVKGKFVLPAGWKVLEKRPFLNGGLPVVAFVFGRR